MRPQKPTFDYQIVGWNVDCSLSVIAARARDSFQKADKKYHDTLYDTLALVLALRREYDDLAVWKGLCSDEFWKKRKKRNQPKVDSNSDEKTRFVCLYVLSDRKGERNDRANKYARVLAHLYKEGIRPEQVVATLKENNGFESMLNKVRKEAEESDVAHDGAQAKRQTDHDESVGSDEVGLFATPDEADENDTQLNNDETDDLDRSIAADPPSNKTEWKPKDKGCSPLRLGIDIDQKRFDLAMGYEAPQRIKIIAVREPGDGKWKSYRVTKLRAL